MYGEPSCQTSETGTTCGSPFLDAVANLHSSFCPRNLISFSVNLTGSTVLFNFRPSRGSLEISSYAFENRKNFRSARSVLDCGGPAGIRTPDLQLNPLMGIGGSAQEMDCRSIQAELRARKGWL